MSTNTVSPKVTAASAAAAVATLLVWLLDVLTGLEVPAGVEGAFVVLLTFAAGYLARDPARGRHEADG